jgi:predicted HicB family RNase H-like nuclease
MTHDTEPEPRVPFLIYIAPEDHEELRQEAAQARTSMSNLARRALKNRTRTAKE